MKKLISAFFDPKFLKFLLVGVVNTLVGSGVMFALYNLAGASYWVSSAMNYIVGGAVSFFLNKHFTFGVKGGGLRQALRFAVNVAVCYLLAYSIAKPLVTLLLSGASQVVRENLAMLAGMGFYTVFNYLGQRFFAFSEKTLPDDSEKA